MKNSRDFLILLTVILVLLLNCVSSAQYALAGATVYLPVNSIVNSNVPNMSADLRTENFWKIIHDKETEIGKGYRQWTLEGLAWVTQVEAACQVDVLAEKYLLPTETDLSQTAMLGVAKREVASAFHWQADDLHPFQVAYVKYQDDVQSHWYVSFMEGGYVLLSREGNVIEDSAHSKLLPEEQYAKDGARLTTELAGEQYTFDYMWPLAVQAELQDRTLPGDEDIPQGKAQQLAEKSVCGQYGVSKSDLDAQYTAYATFYQNRTWQFTFYKGYEVFFQAIVDAVSGKVVSVISSYGPGNG